MPLRLVLFLACSCRQIGLPCPFPSWDKIPILTFPTKVPSDSLGRIGRLKRTSDKSLFPMALGSCGHRITHQLRPINMNGRSILSKTSILTFPTKVPSDSLGRIGRLKRTSDKSLFPMALGSCGVTSQKHQAWDPPSRSARNRSAETKHRRPDPAFKPPAPPSGSGGGAAGALLAAASSAFWRIRSASRGTLPRPRTRSWRYSQKLTPNRRHVFFKLAKVSRARRPESLRVLPLIFRFLT